MAVTYTNVQALSAEMAALSQAVIEAALARALRRSDAGFWAALYDDAVLYLAAHLLAVERSGSGGVGGPVASKSVGQVSVSYGALPWSAVWYNQTSYGREYAALLNTRRYLVPQAV